MALKFEAVFHVCFCEILFQVKSESRYNFREACEGCGLLKPTKMKLLLELVACCIPFFMLFITYFAQGAETRGPTLLLERVI